MRIAMVSEHASPLTVVGGVDAGGQNVHVAALATYLVRRAHQVTVFTRRDDPDAPRRVSAPQGYVVEHVPAGPPKSIPKDDLVAYMDEFGDWLARRWSVRRFDVAHAHFWMSGLAATRAARRTGVPVIQTFHALGTVKRRYQGVLDTSPPGRIALETRLCRDVDHIIATCADEVSELAALGLPAAAATIIPCGVDLDLFQPVPVRPVRDRRARLVTIGRLVPRKGVDDVIDALAILPDAELLVVGGPPASDVDSDPDVGRLRRHARRRGVLDRVRFSGRIDRDRMPRVIGWSDVVVAAPWYEPFGIVPVEAMACGRPVVGSAVGGLLDTVVPGVTGELVPPRDPTALAETVRRLLADDARRQAYGDAGARRAWRHYRWSAVARRTEHVYAAVAARTRPTLAEEEVAP